MALGRLSFELALPPAARLIEKFWGKAVPAASEAVAVLLPRFERLAWECLELALGPQRAARQLALAAVVQGLIVGVQLWGRRQRRKKSGGGSKEEEGMARLANASSLEEWRAAARDLDALDGGEDWRAEGGKGEDLVDAHSLRAATASVDASRRARSLHASMYSLRGGLLLMRDAHGMGSPRLYERAWLGAPLLVEKYVAATVRALDHIVESTDHTVPTDARLAFFNECRHAHGRTALLLSGGAGLGTYHLGVVSALRDSGTLPRVISGASAGSIVAATVCARTDGELEDIYEAVLEAEVATTTSADTVKLDTSASSASSEEDDPSSPNPPASSKKRGRAIFRLDFFRWRSIKNLAELGSVSTKQRGKNLRAHAAGGLMCGDHLSSVIQANVGDWTFQEAFDRTGRILNIPVKAHDVTGDSAHVVGFAPPRLLNYLTAPHVIVWSASRASCAVPGMFAPSPLLVRAADGSVEFESPTLYVDGSMGADLPFETMRTLFNCNHFICSQTNPHAAVLGDVALRLVGATAAGCAPRGFQSEDRTVFGETRRWFATTVALSHVALRFVKAQLKTWIVEGTHLISEVATLRASHHASSSVIPDTKRRRRWPRGVHELAGWGLSLLTQPYEGMVGDVTIVPWAGSLSLFTAVKRALSNPERGAPIIDVVEAGMKNTWRELARIEMHTAVERALEAGVQRLRRRLVAEARESQQLLEASSSSDLIKNGIGRTPSFYTSPSILQLSGLAVVDPPRPNNQRRPSLTSSQIDLPQQSSNRTQSIRANNSSNNVVGGDNLLNRRRSSSDAGDLLNRRRSSVTDAAFPNFTENVIPELTTSKDSSSAGEETSEDNKEEEDSPAILSDSPIFSEAAVGDLVAASKKNITAPSKSTSADSLNDRRSANSYFKTSTMANFYYRDTKPKSETDISKPRLESPQKSVEEYEPTFF